MGVYVTNLELDRNRLADASFISKVHLRERASMTVITMNI